MRVNLSYSVDISQVLISIEKLYHENKEKFEKQYNGLTKLSLPLTNSGLEGTLRQFYETKEVLAEYEIKITEIHGMLEGYKRLLDNPPQPPPAAQPPLPPLPQINPETTELITQIAQMTENTSE